MNSSLKNNKSENNNNPKLQNNNSTKNNKGNSSNLIQQKIKELNEEIFNFKEERNKINKLKEEYEKLQLKLIEDIQQFNDKKRRVRKISSK